MTDSYYDRRQADMWAKIMWLAVAFILLSLGAYVTNANQQCAIRGGIYSVRADICFATSAIVKKEKK